MADALEQFRLEREIQLSLESSQSNPSPNLVPSPPPHIEVQKLEDDDWLLSANTKDGVEAATTVHEESAESLEATALNLANSPLISMPLVMQVEILSFLDPFSLCRVNRTSKLLSPAANHDSIWKYLYIKTRYYMQPRTLMKDGTLSPSPSKTMEISLRGLASFRELFQKRQRLRLDGVYTLTVEYIRKGDPTATFW
jgi:hypothetical protein